MSRPLYEIEQDVLHLNDYLDQIEGDLSDPEVEQRVTEWFTRLEAEEQTKLDQLIGLIRTLRMEMAEAKAESERFWDKARTREKRADYLESRIVRYLTATNRKTATTAAGRTVTVRTASIPPVEITDSDAVEDRFKRIKFEIDRVSIRKALESGEELPYARIGDRTVYLQIR